MKRAFFFAAASLVLAGAVAGVGACASSEDEAAPPPNPDAPAPDPTDAAIDQVSDAAVGPTLCSQAGWCTTPLPDTDLTIKDIWPHAGHAFAVAESPTVGAKVLEWRDSVGRWIYIDDNTQNESGRGKYVGKVWSPSDDEVYFGVAPRTIYHGTRRGDAWSWVSHVLESKVPNHDQPEYADHYSGHPRYFAVNLDYTSLGVFGTSADDVYAWYANAIYHLVATDGGSRSWVVEYVADDTDSPSEQLIFLGATANGAGDVWFTGGRGGAPGDDRACALVVRKTAARYRRVADGVLGRFPDLCIERPGTSMIGGSSGWLTDLHAISANRLVGLKGARELAQISVDGDRYSVALSFIPYKTSRDNFISLWSAPGEPLWVGGFNIVVRGEDVWDGGAYGISTISLNGAWLTVPVYQVRGASNVDRWAVGARYALHKTTP